MLNKKKEKEEDEEQCNYYKSNLLQAPLGNAALRVYTCVSVVHSSGTGDKTITMQARKKELQAKEE